MVKPQLSSLSLYGSIRLGGQRHPVRVPRVRGLEGEARLESYERLHWAAGEVDEGFVPQGPAWDLVS